jgi:hypothetical protein
MRFEFPAIPRELEGVIPGFDWYDFPESSAEPNEEVP